MKAKEGETMSLEAMKQITAAEQAAKERRAAGRSGGSPADRRGGKSRSGFAAKDPHRCGGTGQGGTCGGRGTGGSRAAEIAQAAEQESARQRKQAEARMDAAAELIVERVVKR